MPASPALKRIRNSHHWLSGNPAPEWLIKAISEPGTPATAVNTAMRMRDDLHIGTANGIKIAQRNDIIVENFNGDIDVLRDHEYRMTIQCEIDD